MNRTLFVSIFLLLAMAAGGAESISQALPCGTVGVAGGLGAGVDPSRPTTECPDGRRGVRSERLSSMIEPLGSRIQ